MQASAWVRVIAASPNASHFWSLPALSFFLSLAETIRTRDPDLTPGGAIRAYLEELAKNTSIHLSLADSIGTVIHADAGMQCDYGGGRRLLQRGQGADAIRRDVT